MGVLAVTRARGASLGKCYLLSIAMCQHSIRQGKPWGRGESPHGFFVLLHETALVSLPVGTDPHQTLQSDWHLFHRAAVHLSMYTAKS